MFGQEAWVYSEDKRLSKETWIDIEESILNSRQVVYLISDNTVINEGQIKELALSKKWSRPIVPGWIGDTNRSAVPELQTTNGERLGQGYSVRRFAWILITQICPKQSAPWLFPKPGDFLKVIKLDNLEKHSVSLYDLMYFRQLSPMGLFECFHVEGNRLFWISPDNVEFAGYGFEGPEIPKKYRYGSLAEAQRQWWSRLPVTGEEKKC